MHNKINSPGNLCPKSLLCRVNSQGYRGYCLGGKPGAPIPGGVRRPPPGAKPGGNPCPPKDGGKDMSPGECGCLKRAARGNPKGGNADERAEGGKGCIGSGIRKIGEDSDKGGDLGLLGGVGECLGGEGDGEDR